MRAVIKLSLIVFSIISLIGCQRELSMEFGGAAKPFRLEIQFKAVANGGLMQFNTPYLNASQEPFTLKTFKFYIHNLQLVNTDSSLVTRLSDGHYLIDAAMPASMKLEFSPAANRYNAIALTIGVDSSRNFSGAQTGSLDPMLGMFWTWSSGYIMAKVEGSSPLSTEPNHTIEYHIGGYKSPNNVLKTIILPFPNTGKFDFTAGTTNIITIDASVDAWFGTPNPVHFASNPVVMTPGDLSLKIAENYAQMFTITEIVKN